MLQIKTDPEKTKTGTVASLDELKNQLNIPVEFTDDDTILTALLDTAIETVEDDTHSDIMDVTNVLEHDLTAANFSADAVYVPRLIHIYQAPVTTVSKIELFDGTNWTEVNAGLYNVSIDFNRVEIRIFDSHTAKKIKFTFASGYADAKRPKKLKQAVLLKAADLFDAERSDMVVGTISTRIDVYARLISKHVRTYW